MQNSMDDQNPGLEKNDSPTKKSNELDTPTEDSVNLTSDNIFSQNIKQLDHQTIDVLEGKDRLKEMH